MSNPIHWAPAFSGALRVALGVDEMAEGTGHVATSFAPVFNLWREVEHAFPRGEFHYARFVQSSAVVARNSTIELTLAATVPRLVVLRLIRMNAGTLEFAMDSGAAVSANPVLSRGVPLDGRHAIGESSQLLITSGDTAAGAVLPQFRGAGGSDVPLSWVLFPGGRLFCSNPTQNQTVSASFSWSERQLLPGEFRPA